MDLGTENPSAGGRMNSKDKASWIPVWLLYALAGMFFYGVWGIQSKIVMERVSPLAKQVLSTPGLLLVTLGLWLRREAERTSPGSRSLGVFFAFLTGILEVCSLAEDAI